MKELDPMVFLSVFQEMLGPLLWIMLLVAVVGTVAFLALLVRDAFAAVTLRNGAAAWHAVGPNFNFKSGW